MSATQTQPALNPKIITALEEVFGRFGQKKRAMAREDPEACILSLLERAKKNLGDVSSMLHSTVEYASFEQSITEAKRELED